MCRIFSVSVKYLYMYAAHTEAINHLAFSRLILKQRGIEKAHDLGQSFMAMKLTN